MTDLVPCPLCGANEGYRLSQGSTHRWWLPVCLGCGEQIGECRSDPDLPHTALVPDRWGLADAAWNAAGKHAQGLRDENAALRLAVSQLMRGCEFKTLQGVSAWHAKAMPNDAALDAGRHALAKEPK